MPRTEAPASEPRLDGQRAPVWLVCALTDFVRHGARELDTGEWKRVLGEARALGALHVGFGGGEPLLRDDLEALIGTARDLGFYTNLITGGVPLDGQRLAAMKAAGLNQVRISLQAGDRKLAAARQVKALGLALVLGVAVCRDTIDRIPDILALAEDLGADALDVTQANRATPPPGGEQITRAREHLAAAAGRLKIHVALDDGGSGRPQLCRNDWGTVRLGVEADGTALPCRDAGVIRTIAFPNVRAHSLAWIWHRSPAFNAFRGDHWMKPPCRDCAEKTLDHGGCRCHAYLLTGDAANPDPRCALSPSHALAEVPA